LRSSRTPRGTERSPEGVVTLKVTTGVIHEKTIELDEPLDVADGQRVKIVVRLAEDAVLGESCA